MRTLFVLLLSLAPLSAQRGGDSSQPGSYYTVFSEQTLSSEAAVLTVQQPATGAARRVRFRYASVYCSVACAITFRAGGTAATNYAATVVALNPQGPTALATAFTVSNVGFAPKIAPTFVVPAGATQVWNMDGVELRGNGTARNLSISTDTISGDARIQITWEEIR